MMHTILVALIGLIGSFLLSLPIISHYKLDEPMSTVMDEDSRNQGVEVDTYYDGFFGFDTLVFDLTEIDPEKSQIDVIRVLFQYAEAMQNTPFKKVILAYQGEEKFWIKGDYFTELGRNYATENGVYSVRTFPENVYEMSGEKAFSSWTGGWLSVSAKQLEDFSEFSGRWYMNQFVNR